MTDADQAVLVRTQSSGGLRTITLDSPHNANALSTGLLTQLRAALEAAMSDQDVRVVVLTGAGKVFCAGADLKERKDMSIDEVRARRLKAFAAYDALEKIGKPCIALVEGAAVGSGGEIAMACDFIVATENASFRTPEALWGTVGATQRLPRIVGKRLAKDMAYPGRTLSVQEALQAGLVSRIMPAAEAVVRVRQMANEIAAAPPLAMHLTRDCIDRGVESDPAGALAIEMLAIDTLLQTSDWKQSISTFGKNKDNGAGHA